MPTTSPDLRARLHPFFERGLLDVMPTPWQLLQGSIEMAPYVVMPDAGDARRYEGAPLGSALLRTPVIISQIGWEHFRIGHGMRSSMDALERHLAYVHHEGFPAFDLQLVHTHEGGLARLRRFFEDVERGATPMHRRHQRLTRLVIPDASAYRRQFTAPGGWIDRAEAFDYPAADTAAAFLRPEFTDLVAFVRYCARAFPATPIGERVDRLLGRVFGLATKRLRERGR